MNAPAILTMKKLRGQAFPLMAARHNRRTIQAELGAAGHIDPERTHLNRTLAGADTPEGVAAQAKELMQAAGVRKKLRKDAVTALEAVFSIPESLAIDRDAYFAKCLAWVANEFGGTGNILSADVHNDESNPHMHVLILPLREGRMVGSDMMGYRQTLAARHSSFYTQVGKQFGLAKPQARLVGAAKADAITKVLAALNATQDPALKSQVWPAIRDLIEHDPAILMALLGIEAMVKTKRLKSSTAIFTSPGKGPKKEPKPTGLKPPELKRTLSCVGIANSEGTINAPPKTPGENETSVPELVRVREDEMPAEWWDSGIGAFHRAYRPVRSQKVAAEAWVEAVLSLPQTLTADPVRPKHQDEQPATLTRLGQQATDCGAGRGDVVEQAPIGTNGCRPAAELRNHKVPSGCTRTAALGDATGMLPAQRRGEAGVVQRHWIGLAYAPSALSKAAKPPMQSAATFDSLVQEEAIQPSTVRPRRS